MRVDETDPDAAFFNQNEQVNAYMADQATAGGSEQFHGGKYKPFE